MTYINSKHKTYAHANLKINECTHGHTQLLFNWLSFRYLLHASLGTSELWQINEAGFFTSWVPFLLPNQQGYHTAKQYAHCYLRKPMVLSTMLPCAHVVSWKTGTVERTTRNT